jgi:hypothetical protein
MLANVKFYLRVGLNNQFTIANTTATATAKTIMYSRSGTHRPIDAPQSEQNFG